MRARRGDLDRVQERVEDLAGRLEPVLAALRELAIGGRGARLLGRAENRRSVWHRDVG